MPISTGPLFTLILIIAFGAYFLLLKFTLKIPIWVLALILFLTILAISPTDPLFFSHDVVSYAFDAKLLISYHRLPWLTAPAAFPTDPWLPQNYWPTSTSRYGPIWILLSLPPYLLGSNNLTLTAYSFRLLGILGFLINIFLVSKLSSRKIALLYGLNPYFLIESVASPHTDVWITAFALTALYFSLQNKTVPAVLSLLFSIATKIVSLPLIIPIVLNAHIHQSPRRLIIIFIIFSFIGSFFIIARWSINPWYLYLPISLTYLVWEVKLFRYLALSLSVASAVRYLPYLYLGFFDPHNKIRAVLFLLCLIPFTLWFLKEFHKFWQREIL